jgi:hypothetical protein
MIAFLDCELHGDVALGILKPPSRQRSSYNPVREILADLNEAAGAADAFACPALASGTGRGKYRLRRRRAE